MRNKVLEEVRRIILECIDSKHEFSFYSGLAVKMIYIKIRDGYTTISLDKSFELIVRGYNTCNYPTILTSEEFTELSYYFSKIQKIAEDLLLKDLQDINTTLDIDSDFDNI